MGALADPRGIPGFFVAIFSVVTWIYACPIGWYNRRMEFLGRTAGQIPPSATLPRYSRKSRRNAQ